jgi:hypothetical protein
MGALKDILEESLRNAHKRVVGKSHADITFESYRENFDKLVGEPAIWKTSNNINLKKPQLVFIEKTYKHYVVVSKRTFNLDKEEGIIRYAINYASMIAGSDTIETLE